jgi:hypothetical protein
LITHLLASLFVLHFTKELAKQHFTEAFASKAASQQDGGHCGHWSFWRLVYKWLNNGLW